MNIWILTHSHNHGEDTHPFFSDTNDSTELPPIQALVKQLGLDVDSGDFFNVRLVFDVPFVKSK